MASARKKIDWLAVALVVVSIAPVVFALLDRGPGVLDRPIYDALVRDFVPRASVDDSVVFVDIDDSSLQGLAERWPIQRVTWARLIRKINVYAPAAVALDAFFPEPAARADADLALSVADRVRDTPLNDTAEGKALADEMEKQAALRDADRQLGKAIAEGGNVIVGVADGALASGTLTGGEVAELQPVPGLPDSFTPSVVYSTPRGSIAELGLAARAQAGLHVAYSTDGVMRRYSYAARAGSHNVASLALASAQVAYPKRAEQLAKDSMALDNGDPLLRWVPVEKIRRVPLIDLLDAADDSAVLKKALGGHIVFVGVSAIGAADRRSTPLRSDLPGTYVHITATLNLLRGEHAATDSPLPRNLALGLLGLCPAMYLSWRRFTNTAVIVVGALLAAAAWTGVAVFGLNHGWLVPIGPALLGLVLPVLGEIGGRVGRAERSKAQIREAFDMYLAPAVVAELVANPDSLRLGGRRREITAFFSDVAGFTTISEKLDPADLTMLLNEYLGAMTEEILNEGGTIDKYIGDAIVAMFGAPVDQPDHAVRACRASLACRKKLAQLQQGWAERGLPGIGARIGLNSGVAVVGNMGSARRFDYTMLGDTVNLAARLESANKAYGTDIMVGPHTAELVGQQVVLRELDLVQVKGKKNGVAVYEVVAMPNDLKVADEERISRFAEALKLWRGQEFAAARDLFLQLAEKGDAPSAIFAARYESVLSHPPPPDWDGVFEMKSK